MLSTTVLTVAAAVMVHAVSALSTVSNSIGTAGRDDWQQKIDSFSSGLFHLSYLADPISASFSLSAGCLSTTTSGVER